MVSPERLGAFCEYILRPLIDDIRQIIYQLKESGLTLSEETIRRSILLLGRYHLLGECIRAVCYVVVTLIVSWACVIILS